MPSDRKKILIFSLAYYPRFVGGAEVAVKEITDRIPPDEISFDMVTLRDGMAARERLGNCTIYRIIPGFVPLPVAKRLFPFLAALMGARLHHRGRYDTVWSIMANYAGFGALFFKLLHPRVPFLLTLQEGDPISYIRKRVGIFYFLFKRIFTKADYVQAISRHLAGWAKEMGARATVAVVPNGVDVGKFKTQNSKFKNEEMRKRFGFAADDTVLITTSRLVKKNGIADIVKSMRHLPDQVKLLVAGAGSEEKELTTLVSRYKLQDRVRFLGFVPHDALPDYLHAADIFVRPSLSEGLGNSFLEAMAAGLPVMGTPVGGIVDFLRDRETGIFCRVSDPESIAESVLLLMRDRMLRESVAKRGAEMAIGSYGWDGISLRMKDIFRTLTEKHS